MRKPLKIRTNMKAWWAVVIICVLAGIYTYANAKTITPPESINIEGLKILAVMYLIESHDKCWIFIEAINEPKQLKQVECPGGGI